MGSSQSGGQSASQPVSFIPASWGTITVSPVAMLTSRDRCPTPPARTSPRCRTSTTTSRRSVPAGSSLLRSSQSYARKSWAPLKLRTMFSLYDRDGNGSIDASEMESVLRDVYQMMGESEFGQGQAMFQMMDKDSDGKITEAEFIKASMEDVELCRMLSMK